MEIKLLAHVNLRTSNIERLEKWYDDILGLKSGYRPPFKTNGRWLYTGEYPMVHLLEVPGQKESPDPTNEHFAMNCTGLESFLERLNENGVPYRPVRVPDIRIYQINITDPDGNNMHFDFPPEEADALGFE